MSAISILGLVADLFLYVNGMAWVVSHPFDLFWLNMFLLVSILFIAIAIFCTVRGMPR